jgi:beta-ribofuranosylaminobenzene 5'-phosphate synthase
MTRTVHVRAPVRLHFGMFGFGQSSGPQWGGVGVMVDPPAVEVAIEPAGSFTVEGDSAARAERVGLTALQLWQLPRPDCRIRIAAPPEHTGLGVGTQLSLAIAAGLRRYLELPELSAELLAACVGRGKRSAVGTHGFLRGGLIVDAGKEADQVLGTLADRAALPNDWRFVLISPRGQPGLSGDTEADAFARLPPVPEGITQELWRLTNEEMLPAIERADCAAFGEAVYHFGRFAGECFAAVQGGPFANDEIGRLVDTLRDHGVDGVGQSSWGPTVFAIVPNEAKARALADWLHTDMQLPRETITIAQANNSGAAIRRA